MSDNNLTYIVLPVSLEQGIDCDKWWIYDIIDFNIYYGDQYEKLLGHGVWFNFADAMKDNNIVPKPSVWPPKAS